MKRQSKSSASSDQSTEQQDPQLKVTSSKAFGQQKDQHQFEQSNEKEKNKEKSQIKAMQDEIIALKDALLRSRADMINVQRRSTEQIRSARQYGITELLEQLIPVIDSFEQSIAECVGKDKRVVAIRKGNELVLGMLLDIIGRFGVKPINPLGEVFNPAQHEAVGKRGDSKVKPHTVLEVFRKGYLLHDRVIRAAMVVVADAQDAKV